MAERQRVTLSTHWLASLLTVVLVAAFAITIFLYPNTLPVAPPPPPMRWLLLAVGVWLLATLLWRVLSGRPIRVEMDEQWLYVANLREEIRIALSDVMQVRETRWMSGRPITLELRYDTDFGRTIKFVPRAALIGTRTAHPVVVELETAVQRARGLAHGRHADQALR
jgi:hypothetical protein